MTDGRVLVFGSANQDLVFAVRELPVAGETVLSTTLRRGLGGKGANQAVAARATGADVVFVGAVGGDSGAEEIVTNLRRRGVDTSSMQRVGQEPSGLAVVVVDEHGRNQIVVAPGANAELGLDTIARALGQVSADDVVVVQCEIPADRVEAIIEGAASKSATAIVNLAPPTRVSMRALGLASLIVVNELEARAVIGDDGDDEGLARRVADTTGTGCVVTLGSRGSRYSPPGGPLVVIPADAVSDVVDTTGAGDTYVGTLAARLVQGRGIERALSDASHAAARSVATAGAQPDYTPETASV